LKSLYEISSINLLLSSNDAPTNLELVAVINHENTITTTLIRSRMKIQSTFVTPPKNPKINLPFFNSNSIQRGITKLYSPETLEISLCHTHQFVIKREI